MTAYGLLVAPFADYEFMRRALVGCLALVGRGRWTREDLKTALEAKDRQALGLNAPPEGLYFVEAVFP